MHEASLNQKISKQRESEIEIPYQEEKMQDQERYSPFLGDYQKLFKTANSFNIDPEQIKERLRSSNIQYDQSKFHSQMIIEIEEYSANFEAVKLNVEYGHFEVTVNVINADNVSPFHNLEIVGSGGFGGIYKYAKGDELIAIKSIKIDEDKFDYTFQEVIREYTFLKIASALNVGPKTSAIFGFDIVIFSDSLNFCMEYCEIGTLHFEEAIDLDRKLALLHHMHIVHLDIKPENIGFSNRNGYVFVDFGLSRMVQQKIGQQSLSSFAGSINYCSKQMLDLFSKNCAAYIDLYYNDAFCLGESIKVLNAEPKIDAEMQSISEYLKAVRSNLLWLSGYMLLLETKFVLFQLSSGGLNETNFFSRNSDFIEQKRQQIFRFFSYLPQTLQLISFFKRYLKCQGGNKKINLSDETIFLRNANQQGLPEAFLLRFKSIQNLKCQAQRPAHTGRYLQVNKLFDIKTIKMYRFGLYKLALIQFIKINSFNKDFDEKLLACATCFRTFITIEQQPTGTNLYKRVMQFVFQSSLNTLEPENPQILVNAIETVIILELFDEEYLINTFKQIMCSQITFSQKMRLYLQFSTSLELIIYKFLTIYSYRFLSTFMTKSIKTYLIQNNEIRNKYERSICLKMQEIIQSKELTSQNPHQQSKEFTSFKNDSNYLPFQLRTLNQKIEHMKLCEKIISQILTQNTCSSKNIRSLLTLLNKSSHYCQKFSYLHFLLFRINKKDLHFEINKNIYYLFYQEMKYFEEYKFFDIYLFNNIAAIRQSSPNKLLHQRKEISTQISSEDKESFLNYDQIFQLLSIAVNNYKNRFLFFGQLMIGYPGIYLKRECINHLNCLLKNISFTTKYSANYHEEVVIPHYKILSYEIIVVAHIFEFLAKTNHKPERWDQRIADYIIQCEGHISRIACFKCKVYGLLQVRSLYRMYLNAQERWQESFLSAFDLMVFYMKNKQIKDNTYDIIVPLIRTWYIKSQLFDKYDPIGFIYSITNDLGLHHYTLVDIKEYNFFMNMYLYIAQKLSDIQMVQFVLNISKALGVSKAVNKIKNFYYSILHLVQFSQQKHSQNFHYYHTKILQQLLQYQFLQQHPFVALYFSALLEMQRRCCYSMKMLKIISTSIDFLGINSQILILNRYYEHFAQNCEKSARKIRYTLSLHFKKSSMRFRLPHILKVKIRDKTKKRRSQQSGLFKHMITMFHQNLENSQPLTKLSK